MFRKVLFIIAGIVFGILGLIGLALPVIPQVPFLVASLLFFSEASPKFKKWLHNTKVYKDMEKSEWYQKFENSWFMKRYRAKRDDFYKRGDEFLEKRHLLTGKHEDLIEMKDKDDK
ncbi:MAG: DUF454 family protein [Lachnospiraceae bacterium]|jgi:hypothetical protein|nr:DUF454 family protein [Lachnospiraceae bacterium]MEE3461486.1 DUF454 family protein [Lachnospiraceae bacterium]